MRFEVTERHLREGYPCSCENCPIALAGREALGLPVVVTHASIRAGLDHWYVDSTLRDRIRAIDRTRWLTPPDIAEVRPFTVDLTGVMATVVSEDPAYAN